MAANIQDADQVVLSEDEARSGVTGHNVRHVLAFGLTGVIAAFAAIALYFGYDSLAERLSAAFAQSPVQIVQSLAPYAAVLLIGAILLGLGLGVWSLIAGRAEDGSEGFMRARVAGQFAIVCVIMALLYMSGG